MPAILEADVRAADRYGTQRWGSPRAVCSGARACIGVQRPKGLGPLDAGLAPASPTQHNGLGDCYIGCEQVLTRRKVDNCKLQRQQSRQRGFSQGSTVNWEGY